MIDFAASLPHYVDHLAPIWFALPVEARGRFMAGGATSVAAKGYGIQPCAVSRHRSQATVVAGAHDVWRANAERIVLVEHGAGQWYGPDNLDPGWSGGQKRERVTLHLCPNAHAADRNRWAYPATEVEVVGSPRVEWLRQTTAAARRLPRPRTVVLSGHWPGTGTVPEAGWALPHYEDGLHEVVADLRAAGWEVCGHGHPRARNHYARLWRRLGIPHLREFADVVRRADVYVADNSSTLFEAAACFVPVVVLNAPWYRRDVDWWPRFWAHADVGVQVEGPGGLAEAVTRAAVGAPSQWLAANAATVAVYHQIEGASKAAAEAILSHAR